ncbi:hypothetical protein EIP91_010752 [Steccherinum ochraceum]|uniref:Uncharacterized protein n=1 Tax=Steccherinum ochraceum TaxID=92696 RepID=A0A4R0RLM5_9APHY|nr:hypothetical protein EIP91_010752 [Steccherinum ochraceum]
MSFVAFQMPAPFQALASYPTLHSMAFLPLSLRLSIVSLTTFLSSILASGRALAPGFAAVLLFALWSAYVTKKDILTCTVVVKARDTRRKTSRAAAPLASKDRRPFKSEAALRSLKRAVANVVKFSTIRRPQFVSPRRSSRRRAEAPSSTARDTYLNLLREELESARKNATFYMDAHQKQAASAAQASATNVILAQNLHNALSDQAASQATIVQQRARIEELEAMWNTREVDMEVDHSAASSSGLEYADPPGEEVEAVIENEADGAAEYTEETEEEEADEVVDRVNSVVELIMQEQYAAQTHAEAAIREHVQRYEETIVALQEERDAVENTADGLRAQLQERDDRIVQLEDEDKKSNERIVQLQEQLTEDVAVTEDLRTEMLSFVTKLSNRQLTRNVDSHPRVASSTRRAFTSSPLARPPTPEPVESDASTSQSAEGSDNETDDIDVDRGHSQVATRAPSEPLTGEEPEDTTY